MMFIFVLFVFFSRGITGVLLMMHKVYWISELEMTINKTIQKLYEQIAMHDPTSAKYVVSILKSNIKKCHTKEGLTVRESEQHQQQSKHSLHVSSPLGSFHTTSLLQPHANMCVLPTMCPVRGRPQRTTWENFDQAQQSFSIWSFWRQREGQEVESISLPL